ncbi:adenylate/guanylate cyclase domain-containing protein [Leptolyngbya sp. Cla-17]|uniref:adenylate/guanylate cyclase domain-containing protein n=1 Tax=Leptolyngbya sp. Cla-17 TaxID=2803751 RepID=UPI0018D5E3FF|nr:adenylate/guanylate cyclase domain-containing protein [Leptolyngbya sp. Cla-17]
MAEASPAKSQQSFSLTEVEHLRQEIARLQRTNGDLEIAVQTITEHGDTVEAELRQANQQLQIEIAERRLAQSTLQSILETVARDKADLELILKATAEHGDMVEYQLYTQAVKTMRQSEELFRAISESTPILMILTQTLDGAIVYANSISSRRFGIDPQALTGHQLKEFFADPNDAAILWTLFEEQGSVCNYEMKIRTIAEGTIWVSASVHPMTLAGQQTLLTTLYDINEAKRDRVVRKLAEKALRRSQAQLRQQAKELEQRVERRTTALVAAEEKYRKIFEDAAEGIFQTTLTGQYLNVNPALAKMYGYDSPSDLVVSIIDIGAQVYVQPRRREEIIAFVRQLESVTVFESEVYRKDGSIIWISENMHTVRDDAGTLLHYEGSVRDITDRKSTEEELRRQRLKSERLLLNVLPQAIAERLKRGQKIIADSFTEATVLFADLVGFTELSTSISPNELVELLNSVFSKFDQLADHHQLEKIKTIGDAYMVVAGLPIPRADHVRAIADIALDMQHEITKIRVQDGRPLSLRIGIHTGPVIAGVIGIRRFTYDLWGDTVNVASRMESQGEPERIQVTDAVYNRLKNGYNFERRGSVAIKGKGDMTTYWLLSKKG